MALRVGALGGAPRFVLWREALDEARAEREIRERVFDETNIDVKDVAIVAPDWLVKTTSGKISRALNRAAFLQAGGEGAP